MQVWSQWKVCSRSIPRVIPKKESLATRMSLRTFNIDSFLVNNNGLHFAQRVMCLAWCVIIWNFSRGLLEPWIVHLHYIMKSEGLHVTLWCNIVIGVFTISSRKLLCFSQHKIWSKRALLCKNKLSRYPLKEVSKDNIKMKLPIREVIEFWHKYC